MSRNPTDHERTLNQVFTRLRDHGLVVNQDKCVFGVNSLSFLGFKVSEQGFSPLPAKVSAINDFPLPRTKRQLKSYLGMYQYYSKFIPNYAKFLQPLHLFSTSAPPNLKSLFNKSKTALAESTLLAFPDPLATTELIVDASGFCIGATLQQVNNGLSQPLAFWSKSLTESQKSWSAFERELYAYYASIKHFQYLLDAKEFILKTDHCPIVDKFRSNTLATSPRQQRYFDYIAQMTNKVQHVAGVSNVADALSRPPEHTESDINAILPEEPSLDYLRIAISQRGDPEIERLRQGESIAAPSLRVTPVLLADHGISLLCDASHGRLRPIIPSNMRFDVFHLYHSWSHPGANTGIKLISHRFVWHRMKRDIRQWTRECQACARSKIQRHNIAPLANVTPPPSGRFTNVYVDISGPLGNSKGYNYLLVIIDKFTRFMNAVPLPNISAEECVDAFIRHWVTLFGTPEHIFTDRGTQFTSSLWLSMCN